jgi:hypothetical protein
LDTAWNRSNETSKVVALIKVLRDVYDNYCKEAGIEPETTAENTLWEFPRSGRARDYEDELLALDDLLTRSYWYHAWVVQEIAVSKDILIFCGRVSFSWNSIVYAAKFLSPHVEILGIIRDHRIERKILTADGGTIQGGIQRILSAQSVRNDIHERVEGRPHDSLLFILSNH